MSLDPIDTFIDELLSYYHEHARMLPWRIAEADGTFDPYKILVSELMLQQTQVDRVVPRFQAFITKFPTIESLANSTLGAVLELWIGLGYNRRAKYLHEACSYLRDVNGVWGMNDLVVCKGIGHNTAAAIRTYAYDVHEHFIETNIRTTLLHQFFSDSNDIEDVQVMHKLEEILDRYEGSYREFYWAMMDYGTMLKKKGVKAHRLSSHYAKQPRFEGSVRQLRGALLRGAQKGIPVEELREKLHDERFDDVIDQLVAEELVILRDGVLYLYDVRS